MDERGGSTVGRGGGSGGGGGRRRGEGGGFGRRNMFFATGLPGWIRPGPGGAPVPNADPESVRKALKIQAEALQVQMDLLQRRMGEIEGTPEAE